MAQGLCVPAGGELRRDEECDDSTRAHQLEGPLRERDREVGEVREAGLPPCRPPTGVAGSERLPYTRRKTLRPYPGRRPRHEAAAAAQRDSAAVAFKGEKRDRARAYGFSSPST